MSLIRHQERLTSERLDGEWHAIYPTASRTLCGLQFDMATRRRGRRCAPTCPVCLAATAAFDRIDGSAPERWRHLLTP